MWYIVWRNEVRVNGRINVEKDDKDGIEALKAC
jgi:hypothetical protein